MAKINRFNGNLQAFASAALGTERTVFGSVTQANDLTSQINADFLRGWGTVGPSDQPTVEDFNGAMYTHGQLLAYLHQVGVPEYNATQEYYIGSITNSNGLIYASRINANVGNTPASSPAAWDPLTAGRLLGTKVFDASGTYTPDPLARYAIADVQAGGGQGGGSAAGTPTAVGFGTGGHSGSRIVGSFSVVGLSPLAIAVGAGGSSAGPGAAGQAGGTSSVGGLITCPGGAGGQALGPTPGPSINGNTVALPIPSATGAVTIIISQVGNAGPYGLVINSGQGISGSGGISPAYGGSLTGSVGTEPGNPGAQRGQGGSGGFSAVSSAAQSGGPGAIGKVIIREYS